MIVTGLETGGFFRSKILLNAQVLYVNIQYVPDSPGPTVDHDIGPVFDVWYKLGPLET